MSSEDIKYFKENIIPKMKEVVLNKKLDKKLEERLIKSLDIYYNDGIEDYVYHSDGFNCHWAGGHFTFYPNGMIDPCPGHEYFKSEYQTKIDYKDIDEFMKIENLQKVKDVCFDYCKYCPQGVHHEISFMSKTFHEHNSKEEM